MPLFPSAPEWAITNPVDGVSGLPAIQEPSTAKKDSGFLRLERPPRQDHNWLFNTSGNWLKYMQGAFLDQINGFRILEYNGFGGGPWSVRFSKGWAFDTTGEVLFDAVNDLVGSGTGFTSNGITKELTASFTEGNLAGGMSSSLVAGVSSATNKWYHVFAVRTSSGKLDVAFDDNVSASNLQTDHGITHWRRISSVWFRSLATGFREALQIGDRFIFANPESVVPSTGLPINLPSGFTVSASNEAVPPDVSTIMIGRAYAEHLTPAAGRMINIRGDNSVVNTSGPVLNAGILDASNITSPTQFTIMQNGAVNVINIDFDVTITTETLNLYIWAHEYIDTRGGDWGSGYSGINPQGQFYQ